MYRHRLIRVPSPGFVALLVVLQCVLAACQPALTAKDETSGSAILTDGKGFVPDYVARHAPLVWLHPEDPFRPSDLLEHIRHTTATVDRDPIPDLPELDLDNLDLLNDVDSGDGQVALTSKDDFMADPIPQWLRGQTPDESGRIANATPCVVILVEKTPRDLDAFFFYFYSYDRGPNITQVLEPLDSLVPEVGDMHFGDHVGDWEHNLVRFRDGKPTGVYYSQHESGAAYNWGDKGLTLEDERPVVYSAYGSHANYESEGTHVYVEAITDDCRKGPLWDPALSAYFYLLDADSFTLTRLSPPGADSPVASNLTSFFYYTGRWGDVKLPDSDPRQETVPYFGLKRFVSGPQGPLVKKLLREHLMPNGRGKPSSWMQWGVGIFMRMYPHVFRGWRKWVTLVAVIAFAVLLVLGLKRGVKKLRVKGRGYKPLDTEIPLDTLGEQEVVEHMEGDRPRRPIASE